MRQRRALIAINSGANMNLDWLRHVAERAEIDEAREIFLGVTIPEAKGSYHQFIEVCVRDARDNVPAPQFLLR